MSLPGFTAEAALTGSVGRYPRRYPVRADSDVPPAVLAYVDPDICQQDCRGHCTAICAQAWNPAACAEECMGPCVEFCLNPTCGC